MGLTCGLVHENEKIKTRFLGQISEGEEHGGDKPIFWLVGANPPSPPTTRGNPIYISDLSRVFLGTLISAQSLGGGL